MDGFDARREELLADVDMVIDSDLDDSQCSFLNWLVKSTETSNTDILDQDLNIIPLKELQTHTIKVENHREEDLPRIIVKKDGEYMEAKTSYEEDSAQDFIISPEKVTKSQHRPIVADRFMEDSGWITMNDNLVLHNNRE